MSLRIVHGLSDGINGRGGDFCGGKLLDPSRGWLLPKDSLKARNENLAVLNALRVRFEPFIHPDFVLYAQDEHKFLPQRICAHADDKTSIITAAESFVRNDVRVRVTPTLWRNASVQIAAANVRKPGQLRIEERHVDDLAMPRFFSGKQRRENSHGSVRSARHVRDGNGV